MSDDGVAGSSEINSVTGVFIDETLSEFYRLAGEISVPSLPVKELDPRSSRDLAAAVSSFIPEYLSGHALLDRNNPPSEQHSLHFIKPQQGSAIDFVHIIRLDFKFTGKTGRILAKGDTGKYPSYASDMVYFKSRLVPVRKGSVPSEINSLRLKESIKVETDRRLFTSVIFDEYSNREISIELSRKPGDGIFQIPVKIYPFIIYEYFTACLSIPDPVQKRIVSAVNIFEPLFLFLYFNYISHGDLIDMKALDLFSDSLDIGEDGVVLKPQFIQNLKEYFSSYTLSADDDLMLKGWKKFNLR